MVVGLVRNSALTDVTTNSNFGKTHVWEVMKHANYMIYDSAKYIFIDAGKIRIEDNNTSPELRILRRLRINTEFRSSSAGTDRKYPSSSSNNSSESAPS